MNDLYNFKEEILPNRIYCFYAPPLQVGDVIRRELEARNIRQRCFAEKIGIEPALFNDYVVGKKRINEDVAQRLEYGFGIASSFWMNVQRYHDEDLAKLIDFWQNRNRKYDWYRKFWRRLHDGGYRRNHTKRY